MSIRVTAPRPSGLSVQRVSTAAHRPPGFHGQRRTLHQQVRAAAGKGDDGQASAARGGMSREALIAKIEAAKKYKEAQGGTLDIKLEPVEPAEPSAATNAAAVQDTPQLQEEEVKTEKKETDVVIEKFLATGEAGRQEQQASFLSALTEAKAASTSGSTGELSAQQKLYQERQNRANVKAVQVDGSIYKKGIAAKQQRLAEESAAAAEEGGDSEGSESGAAQFLQSAMQQQKKRAAGKARGMQDGQRMEDYVLQQEQQEKQQEVEFISVEKDYKPKVATWGMFPRPDNISKAYGGGRTIKPGDLLETDEERSKRESRVKDRVLAYKVSQGLVIDEETEAKCSELYENGMVLMKAGQLAEAEKVFQKIEGLVVLMSSWGGRSRLQRALCLDSLARTNDARVLYKQIANHPESAVAKQAKQMMFGIDSMDYLKTHSISYRVGRDDYAGYFKRIKSDWDSVYVGTEEEDENLGWQSAIALAVMASPLLTVAGYVLTK